MSKEVKRFTIGTFHAAIVSAGSECVLASDYDAILAERDRLLEDYEEAVKDAMGAAREATALRKDAERYRWLSKVTPYRLKKLQESATTDGGDVFYFHRDRFDAAIDAALQGEQP